MNFKIEKGIPLTCEGKRGPKKQGGRYPFAQLELGDSFLVKSTDKKTLTNAKQAAYLFAKKSGVRLVARTVKGGVRVWRVELKAEPAGSDAS